MDSKLYFLLSGMMFLEYAIWGAWSPVLSSRLLGPLKMTAKQAGWIYAAIPLASIITPLFVGQIADGWISSEKILITAHFIGGILLFVAARKKTFGSLFTVMGLYALFYASTLPVINSLMFVQLSKQYSNMEELNRASTYIFIWSPVAWVLEGWVLTAWRRKKGTGDGSDCLKLGGLLSLVMVVFCLFLPSTPPQSIPGDTLPFLKALHMLTDTNFLVFLIISFLITTQIWFYFIGTAPYLQDIGIHTQNIPAIMSVAQIAQSLFTWFAFGYCLKYLGFRWTLAGGAFCWLAMYIIYFLQKSKSFVIGSMGLHGIAYVLFMFGGQIYVNSVAPASIKSSAQALFFVVTTGLGYFTGTQCIGIVMDHFKVQEKFQWRKIFVVPCFLISLYLVIFLLFFKA